MRASEQVPDRAELPRERTWNAASVFSSRDKWRDAISDVKEKLDDVAGFQGTLGDDPSKLAAGLEARDDLLEDLEKVVSYAAMSHYCDTRDPDAAGMHNRAQSLDARARSVVSFIEPEILAVGKERLTEWLDREPELEVYRHYLEDLQRRASHVRSEEVEEVLGLVQAPFQGVYGTANVLVNADFEFDPAQDETGESYELTQGTLGRLLQSPDRTLRAGASRNHNATYAEHENSLANNLLTSVRQNVFTMNARRFDSTLEVALFGDKIPTEVFHNLLAVCEGNREIWHRYFEVKRRALDLEKLEPFDIWAPVDGERPEISYEQAVDWVCDGLAPMGREYVETIQRGCLEERWVDVYPNKGKRAGAFSAGTKGTYPFIMMSFTGTMLNLSTLAHELGHSMHSYYAWRNQPKVYSDYSLFAAEVASNFHQAMVRAHLLDQFDDRSRELALLDEAFSNFHRYLLIMPTLARFEFEVHERLERGEGLNADDLVSRCVELFEAAYGDAMKVERQNMGMRWAKFLHLYRDYYVFQYATGISAAHALADRILAGEQGAVADYLGFLKAGGSKHPMDALEDAGVDMREPAPIETAFDTLSGMIDRFEGLVLG